MSEWQPIDTAPTDGREVLGAWYLVRLFGPWIIEPVEWDHCSEQWVVSWDHQKVYPTHWMPLPNPPEDE